MVNVGDKIKQPYPFQQIHIDRLNHGEVIQDDYWMAGCKDNREQGAAISPDGYCETDRWFTCDTEGEIELEVLSVAEMPGRYQNRIIYSRKTIAPDGEEKKTGVKVTTESKFESWASGESIFPADYDVDDF